MKKLALVAAAALLVAGAIAYAQTVVTPATRAAVCSYNASPPTVSSGNFVYLQCSSTGSALVH